MMRLARRFQLDPRPGMRFQAVNSLPDLFLYRPPTDGQC
jgi:hypothetical protein